MNEKEFEEAFIELFAFEISQEIAKASPKDSGRMAKTFMPTAMVVDGNRITWTPPYYWEYVEYGTIKMNPNPFVRTTLETKADKVVEKVLNRMSKR